MVPPKDLGLIPSTHTVAPNIYNFSSKEFGPFLASTGTANTRYTDIHAGKTSAHIE